MKKHKNKKYLRLRKQGLLTSRFLSGVVVQDESIENKFSISLNSTFETLLLKCNFEFGGVVR